MSHADKGFGGLIVDGVPTRVVVTNPAAVTDALDIVRGVLAAQAGADSELSRLNRTFGRTVSVSPTLLDHLEKAFFAAESTSGAVDFAAESDWRALELSGCEVRLPNWMHIDLSATATGVTVDRAAETAAAQLGCGVLVSSADHVSAAGSEPTLGWQVSVGDDVRIAIPSGSGIATTTGDGGIRRVTVAAPSAFLAAALARAAMHMGTDASAWLSETAMPARIVTRRGTPITTAGWPAAA